MHASFCSQMFPESIYAAQGQTILGDSHIDRPVHPNCNTFDIVQKARSRIGRGSILHDPKVAALHFMIAAHPSPKIAHTLERYFVHHLEIIASPPLSHFVRRDVGAASVEKIQGLPGAVSPVPVKLVYVQSPDMESTRLILAWKL